MTSLRTILAAAAVAVMAATGCTGGSSAGASSGSAPVLDAAARSTSSTTNTTTDLRPGITQNGSAGPAWDGRSIAMFGDSYATGYGLLCGCNAYPDRLREWLRGDPPTADGSATTVYNYAINGATVADYLPGGRWYEPGTSPVSWWSGRGLMDEFARTKPTMAMLVLGLNEEFSFNPPVPAATYRANLLALVQALRERNPAVRIVLVHEPGVQTWRAAEWRTFWDAQRDVASNVGTATALDWSAVMPWGGQPWPGFQLYQADQVHLNDAGQHAVTALTFRHIRDLAGV